MSVRQLLIQAMRTVARVAGLLFAALTPPPAVAGVAAPTVLPADRRAGKP